MLIVDTPRLSAFGCLFLLLCVPATQGAVATELQIGYTGPIALVEDCEQNGGTIWTEAFRDDLEGSPDFGVWQPSSGGPGLYFECAMEDGDEVVKVHVTPVGLKHPLGTQAASGRPEFQFKPRDGGGYDATTLDGDPKNYGRFIDWASDPGRDKDGNTVAGVVDPSGQSGYNLSVSWHKAEHGGNLIDAVTGGDFDSARNSTEFGEYTEPLPTLAQGAHTYSENVGAWVRDEWYKVYAWNHPKTSNQDPGSTEFACNPTRWGTASVNNGSDAFEHNTRRYFDAPNLGQNANKTFYVYIGDWYVLKDPNPPCLDLGVAADPNDDRPWLGQISIQFNEETDPANDVGTFDIQGRVGKHKAYTLKWKYNVGAPIEGTGGVGWENASDMETLTVQDGDDYGKMLVIDNGRFRGIRSGVLARPTQDVYFAVCLIGAPTAHHPLGDTGVTDEATQCDFDGDGTLGGAGHGESIYEEFLYDPTPGMRVGPTNKQVTCGTDKMPGPCYASDAGEQGAIGTQYEPLALGDVLNMTTTQHTTGDSSEYIVPYQTACHVVDTTADATWEFGGADAASHVILRGEVDSATGAVPCIDVCSAGATATNAIAWTGDHKTIQDLRFVCSSGALRFHPDAELPGATAANVGRPKWVEQGAHSVYHGVRLDSLAQTECGPGCAETARWDMVSVSHNGLNGNAAAQGAAFQFSNSDASSRFQGNGLGAWAGGRGLEMAGDASGFSLDAAALVSAGAYTVDQSTALANGASIARTGGANAASNVRLRNSLVWPELSDAATLGRDIAVDLDGRDAGRALILADNLFASGGSGVRLQSWMSASVFGDTYVLFDDPADAGRWIVQAERPSADGFSHVSVRDIDFFHDGVDVDLFSLADFSAGDGQGPDNPAGRLYSEFTTELGNNGGSDTASLPTSLLARYATSEYNLGVCEVHALNFTGGTSFVWDLRDTCQFKPGWDIVVVDMFAEYQGSSATRSALTTIQEWDGAPVSLVIPGSTAASGWVDGTYYQTYRNPLGSISGTGPLTYTGTIGNETGLDEGDLIAIADGDNGAKRISTISGNTITLCQLVTDANCSGTEARHLGNFDTTATADWAYVDLDQPIPVTHPSSRAVWLRAERLPSTDFSYTHSTTGLIAKVECLNGPWASMECYFEQHHDNATRNGKNYREAPQRMNVAFPHGQEEVISVVWNQTMYPTIRGAAWSKPARTFDQFGVERSGFCRISNGVWWRDNLPKTFRIEVADPFDPTVTQALIVYGKGREPGQLAAHEPAVPCATGCTLTASHEVIRRWTYWYRIDYLNAASEVVYSSAILPFAPDDPQ